MRPNRTLSRFWAALWFYRDIQSNVATEDNPLFPASGLTNGTSNGLHPKANS